MCLVQLNLVGGPKVGGGVGKKVLSILKALYAILA